MLKIFHEVILKSKNIVIKEFQQYEYVSERKWEGIRPPSSIYVLKYLCDRLNIRNHSLG